LLRQLPEGPVRILDVGGTPEFWSRALEGAPARWTIVVLNLARPRTINPAVTLLRGDACRLPFADGTFDVVFSNSVIEHVGTLEDQCRMANEIQRVGRRFFVQTPNRYFPIEPHFLLPLGQFLPKSFVAALLQRTNLGTIQRRPDPDLARAIVDEIRLLTLAEVRQVFPSATLYKERFAGLTKSFVAYGGWGR
jgi:SAM-dependent methyltransferase